MQARGLKKGICMRPAKNIGFGAAAVGAKFIINELSPSSLNRIINTRDRGWSDFETVDGLCYRTRFSLTLGSQARGSRTVFMAFPLVTNPKCFNNCYFSTAPVFVRSLVSLSPSLSLSLQTMLTFSRKHRRTRIADPKGSQSASAPFSRGD